MSRGEVMRRTLAGSPKGRYRLTMHRIFVLAVAASLALAAPARAQDRASVDEVDTHTTGSVFPGPRAGETRNVWVWRPANAPAERLPVLYMMDGLDGVYVAVAHLQAAADEGRIAPFMIVATDADSRPETRASEYLRGFTGGGDEFAIHERWLIEQVIPWAERTQRAANDREHRFIGGFSNGGDLALAYADLHPDLFGGALAHSPVGASAAWVGEHAATQRWVITGGTQEQSGGLQRGGQLPRAIVQALERRHAAVRACIGRWGHEGRAWRELSPGSVVWLLQLGDETSVATPREQGACRLGAPS